MSVGNLGRRDKTCISWGLLHGRIVCQKPYQVENESKGNPRFNVLKYAGCMRATQLKLLRSMLPPSFLVLAFPDAPPT